MEDMDYLCVLKALDEIPFGVGKKLLIDFLQGNSDNDSIGKNRLHKLDSFGSLGYSEDELNQVIDSLIVNGMIRMVAVNGNRFWKVMELSDKGRVELSSPSLYKRKLSFGFKETITEITEKDRELFAALGDYLKDFNEEQKKAITSCNEHVLCIAGAGSGKTTVLTKRIEFIVRYRSADPAKVLAITFTRKARQEMMNRLEAIGGLGQVSVETFNSFCEKILREHANLAYGRPVRVVTYKDKLIMVARALANRKMDMRGAIQIYFTQSQQRAKSEEQLANIFLNDCFFLRDYLKVKNRQDVLARAIEPAQELVFGVCSYIEKFMLEHGLRDFADQLLDTLELFKAHPELIPEFDHVLVDEYQDVNSTQVNLLDVLDPKNIFCVGDPRQSIYGWRGSDIRYILSFEEKYPGCEITTLRKNYRSSKPIVELINAASRNMGLPDLEATNEGEKDIRLVKFDTEAGEFEFVIQRILASSLPRHEIFVLARTNRQLNELSQEMHIRGITHVVKSDELRRPVAAGPDDITLATIHAIKGMEASMVFVIGCTGLNFPCKGSEHPVVDMIDVEEYDKEEEERRLFYVAMSRARRSLYLSYAGKRPTSFITEEMLGLIQPKGFNVMRSSDVLTRLKDWRKELSERLGVPPYVIMHDRTFIDLAVKMPTTLEDLEDIHGMGPTKIAKYGDEILRIICS